MPGRVQGCSSSPIPVTAPGPATRQEKKQNSSPKLCCAQHLPHDDVLLHPQEREGKGSDRGKGGREKRLMQIKRQLLQPSCKLGANCTHLQLVSVWEKLLSRGHFQPNPESVESAASQGRMGESPQQPQQNSSSTRESSRRGKQP